MSATLAPRATGWDLAVGEPRFLQWVMPTFEHRLRTMSHVEPRHGYPRADGEHELLRELERRHPFKHVVVTCGAKQALLAAAYALQEVYGRKKLHHPAPFWPSYPTIARLRGMPFSSQGMVLASDLLVETVPNNPDGRSGTREVVDVLDLAYEAPCYFRTPSSHYPVASIRVYSATKNYGLSGLRVGWLTTEYASVAKAAAEYVEETTSGVSRPAQWLVAAYVRAERGGLLKKAYRQAREVLDQNCNRFLQAFGDHLEVCQGALIGNGMFAWVKVLPERLERFEDALRKAEVHAIEGSHCGAAEPGWYRFSLGGLPAYVDGACGEFEKEMEA